MGSRHAALALLVAITTSAARATADPTTDPEQLFNEGLALMKDGAFAEALERLEEAQRRDPGIGTEFNVALCYEQLGKLATAWNHYRNVERLAQATGKTNRKESAQQKLDALRPRLSVLVLEPEKTPGLALRVDGAVVVAAEWAMLPVDPGNHEIAAEAGGRKPWGTSVEAPPSGEKLVVNVPILAPVEQKVVTVTTETTSGRRTLGLVIGGIGVAGVIAATVTGILLLQDKSTADAGCRPVCANPDGTQNSDAADAVSRGKIVLPLNLVSWGIAAVGLGLGGYLVLTSGKSKPTAPRTALLTF